MFSATRMYFQQSMVLVFYSDYYIFVNIINRISYSFYILEHEKKKLSVYNMSTNIKFNLKEKKKLKRINHFSIICNVNRYLYIICVF